MAGVSIDALRSVPLFSELDPAELESIADAMHERTFPVGEPVTAEGGVGDGFFIVESGEADVTVQGESRGTMRPGDYFGEIALLMGSERTATITAISELHCYALAPLDFRALVEANPAIAWNVLQSMVERAG